MIGQCWECGVSAHVHDHHPVPKSRGGTRTIPLCESCHGKAHHRDGNMATSAMTRESLHRLRSQGVRLGGAPYGRRHINAIDDAGRKALVEAEDESAVVALMVELRAQGMTLRAIVAELNSRGVPTKRGGAWQACTVGKILRRVAA